MTRLKQWLQTLELDRLLPCDYKAVGDGRHALRYLAPYVYRVAISNRRLIRCEPGPDGWDASPLATARAAAAAGGPSR